MLGKVINTGTGSMDILLDEEKLQFICNEKEFEEEEYDQEDNDMNFNPMFQNMSQYLKPSYMAK